MMDDAGLAQTLRAGAHELGVALTDAALAQLQAYADLLVRWNRVYNLTAVRTPAQVATHHLLDSLVVWPALRRMVERGLLRPAAADQPLCVLDVGSGGGLPGVVLAIADPSLQLTCVDAVAKKAAFVAQVAAQLRLPNLQARHARVETLREPFDLIVARAFASLADLTVWSRAALAPHGLWLAMKGRVPQEELAALPPWVEVFHVEPLTVPGLAAERCLVWMRPRAGAGAPD
jgi:16S rRNA (guanine527-N7)-methyltransferase